MFFFFQAEDGIRVYKVTGVQTCALPIYDRHALRRLLEDQRLIGGDDGRLVELEPDLSEPLHPRAGGDHDALPCLVTLLLALGRSEERRVGKECRPRWRV